jgi:hypothetical protein
MAKELGDDAPRYSWFEVEVRKRLLDRVGVH